MRVIFLNYFLTPFSTSKFGMKTSKHRAVNSSFYTISYDMNGLGKTKISPDHIQLVYTISSDVIGFRQNQNDEAERGLGLSLACFSWQRGKQKNLPRNFKKENIHLIISVLQYHKSNFEQTCHLHSCISQCLACVIFL